MVELTTNETNVERENICGHGDRICPVGKRQEPTVLSSSTKTRLSRRQINSTELSFRTHGENNLVELI